MLEGSGITEITEHKRLHRLQLPPRNRLSSRVKTAEQNDFTKGNGCTDKACVHNSSAADWLWLKRLLQTLKLANIRLMCCLSSPPKTILDNLEKVGFCAHIYRKGVQESCGSSMSTSMRWSTDSVNTDMIILKLPPGGVIRIMKISTTTDKQETSFRVHFTAATLNHSGTLGEELSYVPSGSQQKHHGSGRVMNKSYMPRPLLWARH